MVTHDKLLQVSMLTAKLAEGRLTVEMELTYLTHNSVTLLQD